MIGEFIDCTIYEISKTLSQNNQIGHFPQNTKIFNPLLEKKKKGKFLHFSSCNLWSYKYMLGKALKRLINYQINYKLILSQLSIWLMHLLSLF